MSLLPNEALVRTNDLDQAEWNYRPGPLGYVQRKRFALAAGLVGRGHEALLEIGYGSGIFMPELAGRCSRLYGANRHHEPDAVAAVLRKVGVRAELVTADAADIPFRDESVDALVAVSALEFVPDIDAACREMKRVLRPGGIAVVVTPGYNPLLDVALHVLTGERAEDTFRGRRQLVIPALQRHFAVERTVRYPAVPSVWLYSALRCRRKP